MGFEPIFTFEVKLKREFYPLQDDNWILKCILCLHSWFKEKLFYENVNLKFKIVKMYIQYRAGPHIF